MLSIAYFFSVHQFDIHEVKIILINKWMNKFEMFVE